MKRKVQRKPVSAEQQKNDASIHNLARNVSGQADYQEILSELNAKYHKGK